MPRRVLKVDVLNPDELPDNQEAMGGFPGDGDEYEENEEAEGPEEQVEDDEPVVKKPVANGVDWQAQIAEMQAKLNATQAELAQVRSTIPPPQRKEEAVVEPDWNDEFYKDVPAAVKKIESRIKADLTAQYQQDLATRTFWSRFYAAHPDLEDADDLVRSTLSANMSQLGQLSIPKAIEGLAGLTRTRISGYVQQAMKTRGKKATVEGAGSTLPNSRQTTQTTERPYSLSATIKARRAKRAAAS